LIQAEGLCKSYDAGESRVEVLRDLNFTVSRGETTAVVGVSGVGKSTLLHILGTIDRPTAGRVWWRRILPAQPADLARFRNRAIGSCSSSITCCGFGPRT
jgi:lipoprotein-releasing system ATP-binding protein